ncbi:uncharacterized protein LOC115077478 [Rhinatrema bivittatum]|uniref:uncharacterized protein LOC115077478 n=1 Tax=Rhinatrema bivittatum TaxID=194408 RepID=UPI001129F91A|nr:uncharacterized protein LOC115077478 [Rhinatrema bivittatum]
MSSGHTPGASHSWNVGHLCNRAPRLYKRSSLPGLSIPADSSSFSSSQVRNTEKCPATRVPNLFQTSTRSHTRSQNQLQRSPKGHVAALGLLKGNPKSHLRNQNQYKKNLKNQHHRSQRNHLKNQNQYKKNLRNQHRRNQRNHLKNQNKYKKNQKNQLRKQNHHQQNPRSPSQAQDHVICISEIFATCGKIKPLKCNPLVSISLLIILTNDSKASVHLISCHSRLLPKSLPSFPLYLQCLHHHLLTSVLAGKLG